MQFTPAGASAAHQKLGAGPPGRPVEAASAAGAPERVRAAQFAIPRPSGQRGSPGGGVHKLSVSVAKPLPYADATEARGEQATTRLLCEPSQPKPAGKPAPNSSAPPEHLSTQTGSA